LGTDEITQFDLDYGNISLFIKTKNEWWRLLTDGFLHSDIWHLIFNMTLLWFLGQHLEFLLGKLRFGLLYFGSLLTCAMAEAAASPYWVNVTEPKEYRLFVKVIRVTDPGTMHDDLIDSYFKIIVVASGSSGAIFALEGSAVVLIPLLRSETNFPRLGLYPPVVAAFVVMFAVSNSLPGNPILTSHDFGLVIGAIMGTCFLVVNISTQNKYRQATAGPVVHPAQAEILTGFKRREIIRSSILVAVVCGILVWGLFWPITEGADYEL